jgi:hypothetical protein
MDENTPPDTQAIRRCLLNHRRALADIQQVNLEASFQTPREKIISSTKGGNEAGKTLRNLMLYSNPAATFTVLVAGSFLFSSGRFITSSSSGFSLISTISFTLLGRVAYHVMATILSAKPHTKVANTDLIDKTKNLLGFLVDQVANLHDIYIASENAYQSFIVSGCLWLLGMIGKFLSTASVCYLAFFIVFTVPAIVNSHGETFKPLINRLVCVYRSKFEDLGLSKRKRSMSCIALVSFVWLCSGWANRLIGIFMVLLWVRCTLNSEEVQAIRQQAAPLTMSVKKSAKRFSTQLAKALRST